MLTKQAKKKKTYRQRMIEAFDKNPFICPHCHREMELVEIWHAEYGFLYHDMEGMECVKYRRNEYVVKQKTG
ncbi:hypothetical protein [Halalkalibacter sp. APA_J-10(15)]|uniref:hypothetical protein n=1 Tax=Halalkalibacter sp. APA_J-10(15) TaxID=2933805 RepID=UPI0034D70422